MTDLSPWWPESASLTDILKSDAIVHAPAVVLAVHQSMTIQKRRYDVPIGGESTTTSELDILSQLRRPIPDGCQVILIEGASGTGKSHVVRWLNIQLERDSDSGRRVLHFVHKGSRLFDIVERLCAYPELAESRYDALRAKLRNARQTVTPRDAANRLCNQLAYVCEERGNAILAKIQRGEALSGSEELDKKWCLGLLDILRSQELNSQLVGDGGCMDRIVRHIHTARTESERLEGATAPEFTRQDLQSLEPVDGMTVKAILMQKRLQFDNLATEVAGVLNRALDEAKLILSGLTAGDVLSVFTAIRQALLDQNKELVLLVEDFADLSGIQKEILQAAIQTAVQSGVRQQCDLRTVLAYTDGYLAENTVKSRAQHVYYLSKDLGREEVVNRSVELVASYLHAARVGRQALEKAFAENVSVDGDSWLPSGPHGDEEQDSLLKGFGTIRGKSLFPFTRTVIERMLDEEETPRYVPRDIINDLMRRVLDHRESFLKHSFPSDAFRVGSRTQLKADAGQWIRVNGFSGLQEKRAIRFALYWGPNHLAATAFGIDARVRSEIAEPALGQTQPQPQPQPQQPPLQPDAFSSWTSRFEDWRGRDDAIQGDAAEIRKSIARAIRAALTFNWIPRRQVTGDSFELRWKGWAEDLEVAGLRSADDSWRITIVSPDERNSAMLNGRVAKELAAVCGAPKAATWNADGVEEHLAAYLSFIERHRKKVEGHLLRTWHRREWNIVPFLVNSLQRTGALLGIEGVASKDRMDRLHALLAPAPEPASDVGSLWVRDTVKPLRQLRKQLIELLEDEHAAFQGTGATVHAIDVVPILSAIEGTTDIPLAPRGLNGAPERRFPRFQDFPAGAKAREERRPLGAVLASAPLSELGQRARAECEARRTRAESVSAHLGEQADMRPLRAALDCLLGGADTELSPSVVTQLRDHLSSLEKFRAEVLHSAKGLPENSAPDLKLLAALARDEPHAATLKAAVDALTAFDDVLKQLEQKFSSEPIADELDAAEHEHEIRLRELKDAWAPSESLPSSSEEPHS